MRYLLSLCLSIFWTIFAAAETLSGYVVGVSDGDTIAVLDANRQQHKIRLAGIDAPEKKQPFGDQSQKNLAATTSARSRPENISISFQVGSMCSISRANA